MTTPPLPTIEVYSTLTRTKRPLVTVKPGHVGMYLCGPTVYKPSHIGHMVGPVIFDTVKRHLAYSGWKVTWVVNVTDVDDKIIVESAARGTTMAALAAEMTADYLENLAALGVTGIDEMPKATEHIGTIIAFIEGLVAKGCAYASDGDVYFDVTKDADYGKLTNRSVEQMQGEGGSTAERKRSAADFALWKKAKPGEPAWDSPWGPGRPGWHIECSAMSKAILGPHFDIHGGGLDLVFPHHENEAAQTRMARGSELARIWMHNGMLQLAGEKMAKSTGNIEPLAAVVERWGPEAVILFFVSGHYRQPLLFGDTELEAARTSARRIREQAARTVAGPSPEELSGHREAFFDSLADDFNTPKALAALHAWLRGASGIDSPGNEDLVAMLTCLGLESLLEPAEGPEADESALALLREREEARAAGDFERADALRDELAALGWEVRDGAGGAELVRP